MKRPDKTRQRTSVDQLIREADGVNAKMMLATYGVRAQKLLQDPLMQLVFALQKVRSMKEDPLDYLLPEPVIKNYCDRILMQLQNLMLNDKDALEKLTKAERRIRKLTPLFPSPLLNPRVWILMDHFYGALNIYKMAKEWGIEERKLWRLKASMGLTPKAESTPDK
jgi:hypothetical protein